MMLSWNAHTKESSTKQLFDLAQREISVIVTDEGYYPEKLAVFQGERVRFFITSTTKKPSCFMMNSQEIFLSAELGKITEAVAYFDRSGSYNFFCPTGKLKGKLTVLPKRVQVKREIASKKSKDIIKVWMPK